MKRHPLTSAALLRSEMKGARTTETHDRHQRVDFGPSNSICVPGNAVASTFVVVAEEPIERPVVVRGELVPNLLDDPGYCLVLGSGDSGASWFVMPCAVHESPTAGPVHDQVQLSEKRVCAMHKSQ